MFPDGETVSVNLGFGGNVGDPRLAISQALNLLNDHDEIRLNKVSRLFKTPPWGNVDQGWFFNACANVETTLDAEALLDVCLGIERAMKRERIERWGPRTLDIDILTYGDQQISTERLTIPHTYMAERAFVLKPLADYAPELLINGKRAIDLLAQSDQSGIEVASDDANWWRI